VLFVVNTYRLGTDTGKKWIENIDELLWPADYVDLKFFA
jgi:hypothetical protein